MQNICRAITLYSSFVQARKGTADWDYVSLGTVDGIDVSSNLLEETDGLATSAIRAEQIKFKKRLNGKFSAQQFFIVRNDDKYSENEFWERDDKNVFFFFCRCQLRGEKEFIQKERDIVEKTLEELSDTKVRIYQTYDNTDIFLIIKARKYENGAMLVNSLHKHVTIPAKGKKKISLKNSYTILAFQREWLDNLKDATRKEMNKQIIQHVQISVMESMSGSLQKLKDKIEGTVRKSLVDMMPVFGENDDVFLLNDVPWGDFLRLYQKDGVFRNDEYNGNFASAITQIVTTLPKDISCYSNAHSVDKTKEIKSIESDIEKYVKKVETLIDISRQQSCEELNIILNALPKFTGEVFNDYLFFMLIKPIEVMLYFITEKGILKKPNVIADYYVFINNLHRYIQTSSISDKHTVQGLGFNSKMYDIPVKISAFYNAFLYKMSDILNINSKVEYVFLIVLGMQFNVNVNELYPHLSTDRRLIVINIPEEGFYIVKNMMNILAHESGHYIGREFRHRKDRLEPLVRTYIRVLTRYMFSTYNTIYDNWVFEQGDFEKIADRIYDLVIMKLQEYEQDCEEDEIYYLAKLRKLLLRAITEITDDEMEVILGCIGAKFGNEEEAKETIWNMHDVIDSFLGEQVNGKRLIDAETVYDELNYYYEECFADIMSILILGTTVKDYIECIFSEAKAQGTSKEKLQNTEVMFRIGTVVLCIYSMQELYPAWNQEVQQAIKNDKVDWCICLRKAIKTAYGEEILNGLYETNVYAATANKYTFDQLKQYLTLCIDTFMQMKNDSNHSFNKRVQDIQILYKRISEMEIENAEKQIQIMSNEIEEYRKNFMKKL